MQVFFFRFSVFLSFLLRDLSGVTRARAYMRYAHLHALYVLLKLKSIYLEYSCLNCHWLATVKATVGCFADDGYL